MPPRLARYVKRVVVVIGVAVCAWGIVAAAGHVPLEGGTFEFGHPMSVSGRLVERPYRQRTAGRLHHDRADAHGRLSRLTRLRGKWNGK